MDGARHRPSNVGTPEIREAVRSQIVAYGRTASPAIAAELDVPHATVVRVLHRFAAVGALDLVASPTGADAVAVVPESLSDRFRDLSAPLW
jgi:hypothetical protein